MTTYERIIQLINNEGYYIFKETYVTGQTTYDIVKNTGPGERSVYCRISYNLVGRIVKETGNDMVERIELCVACNFTPETPAPNHVITWHHDYVEPLFNNH